MNVPAYQSARQIMSFGNGIQANNRMYFASMGLDLCNSDGFPLPEFYTIYNALIKGGCGFGFLGNASVDVSSRYNGTGLKLTTQEHAQALKPLFDAARASDFPLGIQLQHYGAQGLPSHEDGTLLSPSAIPSPSVRQKFPHAKMVIMDERQIAHCIAQFADAARLAQQAGAGLIQLQASNGYLISSFLSPRTNQRQDDWGGTPLKRARLLLEIINAIRHVTNHQLPVTVRLGINDGLSDGQQVEMLGEVAAALEAAGVVAITCSIGTSETFRDLFSRNGNALHVLRHGSRFLKKFTHIPVGFTGSVSGVAVADKIIASGDADFIGFGRAVLADNELVAKELSGKESLVNRCLWEGYCFRDKSESSAKRVYCCVNPAYQRPDGLQKYYKENPR